MQPVLYPIRWLVVALTAVLCVVFYPYIFGGKSFLPADMFDTMVAPFNAHYGPPQAQTVYYYDALTQTFPYKLATQEALRAGRFAYWNPRILCGYPQYAEPLGNNFDVFNILLYWCDVPTVLLLQTLLELLIAGVGMLLLLRYFGISRVVNITFSSAYMLNSLFVANVENRWMIASFCWIPFAVLMALRHMSTRQWKDVLYASLFLALAFLGGTFQTSFFASFIIAGVMLLNTETSMHWHHRLSVLLIIGSVAALLAAFMFLPSLELMIQTVRHGSLNSSVVYRSYSVLQRLLTVPLLSMFFDPSLMGSPDVFGPKKIVGADVMDFNGGIAFLPALFACTGCIMLWRSKAMRPFIILTILAIVLPLFTPLYNYLYHRVFIVASFSLCVIGAVSLQSFLDEPKRFDKMAQWTVRIFVVFVVALAAISTIVTVAYDSLRAKLTSQLAETIYNTAYGGNSQWMYGRIDKTLDFYSFTSLHLWLPVLLALVIVVTLVRYRSGRVSQNSLLGTILTATIFQLALFIWMWLPSIDLAQFPLYPRSPITNFLRRDPNARYITVRGFEETHVLPPNHSTVYGINEVSGYESFVSPSFWALYHRDVTMDSLDTRLLGLASCKYILVHSERTMPRELDSVFAADGLTIYQNHYAKPRAYFATSSLVLHSHNEIDRTLLRPTFSGDVALFDSASAPRTTTERYDTTGNIQIASAKNDELVIRTETNSRALLMVTDSYYPGWHCNVNGKDQPIYCVNNYMRGVFLTAGKSIVTFRFEPEVFTVGASISGFSLAGFVLALLAITIRSKNTHKRAHSMLGEHS